MQSPGGSKHKGSQFERELCSWLSLWVSDGKRTDIFWRSAMSGGRATVKFKKGEKSKNQSGDITAIDSAGEWLTHKFVIEAKFYQDLDIETGIINQKGVLYGFWLELQKYAYDIQKEPLLVARQNRVKSLILISPRGEATLRLDPENALAILPLWGNARIYLLQTLLQSKYCKTVAN